GLVTTLGPERMSALVAEFFKLDIAKLPRGPQDLQRTARIWAAWKDARPGVRETAVAAAANANTAREIRDAMRLAQRENKRRASAGPSNLALTIELDDADFAAVKAFTSPIVHAYIDGG